MDTQIEGVAFKPLITHPDARGYFRELIRETDAFYNRFGQLSHSVVYTGVIKAWHHHEEQTDYWYVVSGVLRVGLHDLRPDSPTRGVTMDFPMGDHRDPFCLKIPPGVLHGCKALQGPVHLLYLTSHTYNPSDELRRPFDDPEIGFDWFQDYRIV